ncbi:MFS transporter [Paenibacillus sp. 1P07SE]|uniref:MFS transporter n=1 Tax=Paenibacillus sp. 1P07SE TaxID=3132209 RepID=UPI0039A76000
MSTPSSTASLGDDTPQITLREGAVTLLLGFSIVMVIMNTMMFNLALPDVSEAFAMSAAGTSWIVTGYSIVFAIATITYSRLSDFVPIRTLYLTAISLLGTASFLGLFSGSFIMLLAARILQAAGAGAMPALSIVLVTRYIPLQRRGKAMATVMAAASLGLGLGPVAGGFIVQLLGWRYLFAVTALSLLLLPFFVRLIPRERKGLGAFDAIGALLIGIGTTGCLLLLTYPSWAALAAGVGGLLLFALRIRRASDPFVQPSLFGNRTYLMLIAVGIAAYLCSFATLFLMPQILIGTFRLNAIQAGLVIFPGSLLAMLLSRRVGSLIDSYGNGMVIRYAPFLLLASVVLFALLAGQSYLAILFIYMLLSVGFTALSSSVSNELSRILPAAQIGSGLGLFQLLQFFSGAFAVAAAAAAMEWQRGLPPAAAYGNIYWGISALVLLAIGCASLYLRRVTSGSGLEESA